MNAHVSHPLADQFRNFVLGSGFPCVGAKSALARDQLRIVVAGDIRSARRDDDIFVHVLELADEYRANPNLFQSLAVIFPTADELSEEEFEKHLWRRLQKLSERDDRCGLEPDPRVSSDPNDPHFSISFGGEGFFVVGLHPGASRPARRFTCPVIVFNPHAQFEQLRSRGVYQKLRTSIIDRDIALAGNANPMLAEHGSKSAARQYSGRLVGEDWQCPMPSRRTYKPERSD